MQNCRIFFHHGYHNRDRDEQWFKYLDVIALNIWSVFANNCRVQYDCSILHNNIWEFVSCDSEHLAFFLIVIIWEKAICPSDTSWPRFLSREVKSISADEFVLHQIYLCAKPFIVSSNTAIVLFSSPCGAKSQITCEQWVTLGCVYWWVGFVS